MKIDNEFKSLIPAVTKEEFEQLEKNILSEGVRDRLVVWNDILLDGHNRYNVCKRNNITFQTKEMQLKNRTEAKRWIILNQFGRRNLSAYQRSELALKLKPLLAEQAKERQREHGKTAPGKKSLPQKSAEVIDTRDDLAKIAGVSHDTISKVEKIQQKAPKEIQDRVKRGELTINKAYVNIKRQETKENAKAIEPPKGKYRILYADPPWCYGDKRDGQTTGAEDHYPSMTIKELCELPIAEIADDNAVLFLWVTSPLLEDSFKVIHAWGFVYKTSFVWNKIKHNMGHYNSVRHEFLLICTKGSCLPDKKKLFNSVVSVEKSETHSEKPEEFRKIIETIYTHGNKLELFGRKEADGWKVWGNQVTNGITKTS